METYYYWTIAGFISLFAVFFTSGLFPILFSGSMFFAAVIAFKFPDEFLFQISAGLIFAPLAFIALKSDKRS
ncbi:MAG: hypothetical protein LUE64_01965 [Candidatus Gastranaerophilales bacterium]|nr:hypothetical protein [Candidatus Gastranaerophilales bacterium]